MSKKNVTWASHPPATHFFQTFQLLKLSLRRYNRGDKGVEMSGLMEYRQVNKQESYLYFVEGARGFIIKKQKKNEVCFVLFGLLSPSFNEEKNAKIIFTPRGVNRMRVSCRPKPTAPPRVANSSQITL